MYPNETEDEAVETPTSIEAVHMEGANWQLHLPAALTNLSCTQ